MSNQRKASKYIQEVYECGEGEWVFILKRPYQLRGHNVADFSEMVDDHGGDYDRMFSYAYDLILSYVEAIDPKVWDNGGREV